MITTVLTKVNACNYMEAERVDTFSNIITNTNDRPTFDAKKGYIHLTISMRAGLIWMSPSLY